MTDSVQPFGFHLIESRSSPPLSDLDDDRVRKQADLFDPAEDCQADELECVHKAVLLLPWPAWNSVQKMGDGRWSQG